MEEPQQPFDAPQPAISYPEQIYPSQIYQQRYDDNILKTVIENEDLINLLEHEFRGEILSYTNDMPQWIKKYPPVIKNDEAITEIIRMLRFMGLNKITILTNLDENLIAAKLATFEYKLADLFFLKRERWGIDKEEMPMIYHMIISIVEDAVYRAKGGFLIETLRRTYHKEELEHTEKMPQKRMNIWPFK